MPIDVFAQKEPIPMTDEQKFIFDLKGWIAIPGALTEEETEEIKAHVFVLSQDRDSLDAKDRYSLSGPAQILLDHPVVVGTLREVLKPDRSDDCYGFRCESSFSMIRSYESVGPDPHGGGRGSGAFAYNCVNQNIYSGLTRVVWELNEVNEGDGGTLFMSGSHKSNFSVHESHRVMDSPLYESYTCPPGSMVVFSESVCHAGPKWNNPNHPRVAIFNCYSPSEAQYHKMNLPPEVIEAMPPKRQTLFRGVWHHDFSRQQPNDYYSVDNRSL